MKKFLILLVFIAFILGSYIGYSYFQKMQPSVEAQVDQQINADIEALENELSTYKDKMNQEKVRKLELQALQNPEIITQELNKVGKLLVYQGKEQYSDYLKETTLLTKQELTIQITYNFGIAIDLNSIIVNKFYDKTVLIKIPKDEIKLEYIEADGDNFTLNEDRNWLTDGFTPDEIEMVVESAFEETKNKIINDKQVFLDSMESLKENLRELILKLGFEEVIFEIQ
jgi:hypothetical protein